MHCKSYYSLEVSYFKSALDNRLLDSLWNKYWVKTLSSTNLLTVTPSLPSLPCPPFPSAALGESRWGRLENAAYITGCVGDVAEKLEGTEALLSRGPAAFALPDFTDKKQDDKFQVSPASRLLYRAGD